jgi:hypothetical protein
VAGIASVICFSPLADRLLPRFEATVAIGVFAMSQALIGAGVGVKPYSIDVLISVTMAWLCLPVVRDEANRFGLAMAATAGTAGLWIFFSAVFVLAGLGLVIALRAFRMQAFRPGPRCSCHGRCGPRWPSGFR